MVITQDKILCIQLNLDESDKKSLEKIFYPLNLMNEMICALFIQIGIHKKILISDDLFSKHNCIKFN